MPMGPAPLGFVYFVGVKFFGYTGAALVIRKVYPEFKGRIFRVGLTRTAIGIGAGAAYGALWFFLSESAFQTADPNPCLYFCGLLPVRIAEWMWLVHLFFYHGFFCPPKTLLGGGGG